MGAPPVLSVGLAVAVGWAPRWSTPIDAVGLPSAADCAGCHPEQAARWADSGHRSAWTSPLFAAGFAAEPQPWCASCHAPLPEMRAEVVANLPWYARQDPRRLRFGPAPTRLPEPRAAEGVTCVACHAPDGGPIRGTRGDVDWAAHEVVRDPGLTDGTACRGCHEFPMPRFVGSVAAFTDQPMQSTASEWDRYRAAGGEGT
ncbi:MAG: hypothetical protein ABMB14_35050, partial [Myxococcota bacterium]